MKPVQQYYNHGQIIVGLGCAVWRVGVQSESDCHDGAHMTATVLSYDEQTGEIETRYARYVPYMRHPENV